MAKSLVTWNVNGIRAVTQKGFFDWMKREEADVICLQETKAQQEQLDLFVTHPSGYESHWFSAEKPGYSGLAVYLRSGVAAPLNLISGLGDRQFDSEGRVQQIEFKDFVLINAYFPNSQREHTRLPYKLAFCEAIEKICSDWRRKGKSVIVCGDYNIAHEEIDLKNPKSNQDNAGFLPEERAWMTRFLKDGFVDAFRSKHPGEPGHYTWWSYRPGVRERNIGWRLDYFTLSEDLQERIRAIEHQPLVMGSDHCPVRLELG